MRACWVVKRQSTICLGGVALTLPGGDFLRETLLVWEPAMVEALAGENPDLDLRSKFSQLPCLGGVVDLKPLGEPPGFLGWERLIQARWGVGVKMVQNQHDLLRFRVDLIHQRSDDLGKVQARAALPHKGVTGVGQGLKGHEHVAGARPRVFKVLPRRAAPAQTAAVGGCRRATLFPPRPGRPAGAWDPRASGKPPARLPCATRTRRFVLEE